MRRANPQHRSREAKQRRLVRQRDNTNGKNLCLMQRKTARGWVACGRFADQTIHIIRRWQCGEFWDALEVVILGCEECHKVYDHRHLGDAPFEVRAPFEYAAAAWLFLLAKYDAKELIARPYGRYNPFGNGVYVDLNPVLGIA